MFKMDNKYNEWAMVNGFKEPNWMEADRYCPNILNYGLKIKIIKNKVFRLYLSPYDNTLTLDCVLPDRVISSKTTFELLEFSHMTFKEILNEHILMPILKKLAKIKYKNLQY